MAVVFSSAKTASLCGRFVSERTSINTADIMALRSRVYLPSFVIHWQENRSKGSCCQRRAHEKNSRGGRWRLWDSDIETLDIGCRIFFSLLSHISAANYVNAVIFDPFFFCTTRQHFEGKASNYSIIFTKTVLCQQFYGH